MTSTAEPTAESYILHPHSPQDEAFYTSDTFIGPLRKDVASLLASVSERLEVDPPSDDPLSVFKQIWIEKGWSSIHLKCIALRSRVEFLKTITNMFIEKLHERESIYHQTAAFFALYTFFTTQPSPDVKDFGLPKIPVSMTENNSLETLPERLPASLRDHVRQLLQSLQSSNSIAVLSDHDLQPQLPMYIPKTGRPSIAQTKARSLATTSALEAFLTRLDSNDNREEAEREPNKKKRKLQLLSNEGPPLPTLIAPDPKDYVARKAELKKVLPQDILLAAEGEMRDTMDGIEAYAAKRGIVTDTGWKGVEKLKTRKGMLDFIEDDAQETR